MAAPRIVTLKVAVEIDPSSNPDEVAERLLDFLASDPDDVFPEVATVLDFGWAEGEAT